MCGAITRIFSVILITALFILIPALQSQAQMKPYTVLLGSHQDNSAALEQAADLGRSGLGSVYTGQAGKAYNVYFGRFTSTQEAQSTVRWLNEYSRENKINSKTGGGPLILAVRKAPEEQVQVAQTKQENTPPEPQAAADTSPEAEVNEEPQTASGDPDYYGDPTVAGNGWKFGIAMEGRYAYAVVDSGVNNPVDKEDEDFFPMFGVKLMIGKGDFTLLGSYRAGSSDFSFTNQIGGANVDYKQEVDATEFELKGRYILTKAGNDWFVPFVSLGLLYIYEEQHFKTVTPGYTFTATGKTTEDHELTFFAPMLGVGAIVPFGKTWGLRAEANLLYSMAERKRKDVVTGWSSKKSNGLGIMAGGAFYWSITPHVGMDLGLNYMYLNGGDDVGQIGRADAAANIYLLY